MKLRLCGRHLAGIIVFVGIGGIWYNLRGLTGGGEVQVSEALLPFHFAGGAEDAEAAAMLRAVLNLFEKWQLKPAEIRVLLGSPSERTLQRWRAGQIASVPHDTRFRLGCLLGIHKALRFMFTAPERAYAWVRKPNEAFGGLSALAKMLQGAPTDIAEIRNFLDAERAGW
jgi:hypothetical protein